VRQYPGAGEQHPEKALPRAHRRADYDYQSSAYLNYGDRPAVAPLLRAAYGTLGANLAYRF
jgi:hypothetical protein